MASLNSDGSGSGARTLGPFCYLFHAQQTKGTAAPPLIAMGDSLLLIMTLLSWCCVLECLSTVGAGQLWFPSQEDIYGLADYIMDRKSFFWRGILDGLSSSMTAFSPKPIETPFNEKVLEPSYRPPEEDRANMRQYFEKAITHARKEVATAE